MLARAALMVIVTVICLAAMGTVAYAFFSYDITSGNNRIQAASLKAEIQITGMEAASLDGEGYVALLYAGEEYAVTIRFAQDNSASTGFVILNEEGSKECYHTQQLTGEAFTFYLTVQEDAQLRFRAHWGTSSYYGYKTQDEHYIKKEEHVTISADGATKAPPTAETESKERVHVVERGENLTVIAKKYNTTVDAIVARNKIANPDLIWSGQSLWIPSGDWVPPTTAIPDSTAAATTAAVSTLPSVTAPATTAASTSLS